VEGAPIAPLWEHALEPEYLRKLLFADPEGPLAMTLVMHPEEMPEEMLLLTLKAGEATARVGWNPYLHNPKLRGRLHRIRTPTLVLWGDKDGLIPPAHGRVFADPRAKLRDHPNCATCAPRGAGRVREERVSS
jgi:pimeloyl-ACP methyl ester carboxylesterase